MRRFSVLAQDGSVTVRGSILPEKLVAETSKSFASSHQKVQRAVLYEQLNSTNKRLIFRPTKAHLVNKFDLPKHKGQELEPTQYLGVPSKADYFAVVSNAEDPLATAALVEQCILHKTTARNIKPEHISALLRKAAELGQFEDVWHYLSVRGSFRALLTSEVYLEALRIIALRAGSKSKDVKNQLYRLYSKSPEDVRREAALLYGLTQYKHVAVDSNIAEVLARLKLEDVSQLDGVDAALAAEASQALGEPLELQPSTDEVDLLTVAV